MNSLVDSNVLIALAVSDHVHHEVAHAWFAESDAGLVTCPITEGALIRFLIRSGNIAAEAMDVLQQIHAQPWHQFVPDSIAFDLAMLHGVIGHRQVTDAYLVALAAATGTQLVTLDRGLAALHGNDIFLLG
jgi:toxin-antitoxin system PIN domain toxin